MTLRMTTTLLIMTALLAGCHAQRGKESAAEVCGQQAAMAEAGLVNGGTIKIYCPPSAPKL